jgi:hypothetical protein
MSDPYADRNGSQNASMFDPYADRNDEIWPEVRSNLGQKWLVGSEVRSHLRTFVLDLDEFFFLLKDYHHSMVSMSLGPTSVHQRNLSISRPLIYNQLIWPSTNEYLVG